MHENKIKERNCTDTKFGVESNFDIFFVTSENRHSYQVLRYELEQGPWPGQGMQIQRNPINGDNNIDFRN